MDKQKAKFYNIKLPLHLLEKQDVNSRNFENIILKYINNTISKDKVPYKRGDIIHPEKFSEYRNSFKYIYNGTKFETLGTLNDEYGEVPKSFLTFTEFPPYYWTDIIEHNENHYIKPSLLKMEKIKSLYKGIKIYIYTVKYKSKNYKIASTIDIEKKKVVVIEPVFENKYFDFVVKTRKYNDLQRVLEF